MKKKCDLSIVILVSCFILLLFNCSTKKINSNIMKYNNFNTLDMLPFYDENNKCDSIELECIYSLKQLTKIIFKRSNNEVIFEDSIYNINGTEFFVHKKENKYICTYKYENTLRFLIFDIKNNLLYLEKIKQLKPDSTLGRMLFDSDYTKIGYKSINSFLTSDIFSALKIKEANKRGYYRYAKLEYKNCFFKYSFFQEFGGGNPVTSAPTLIKIPEIKSLSNCLYLDIDKNDLFNKEF